ncbi:MAG: tryptophan 2,3-dioxygenase [Flavobacteriales bacterium]|nr:tryptophan 2,3-dioxygenase [Bacteroidota bacterium]MCB9240110.1 tryptophan 2,3-dioxygenase [Flavobacteriales bacterium]
MSRQFDDHILDLVQKLEEKYKSMGQDLASYLEGRLYEDYVPYWDYVHLDTLLTLQKPKTPIPDEMIFIMYHQVTELYFKMILHELEQIANQTRLTKEFLIERLKRINRYFIILTDSFTVMSEGMEQQQFLEFRMALLPASGFQSAQYRMIEIASTEFINLVSKDYRHRFTNDSEIAEMYKYIYWQAGATVLATGEKTLTLHQFELKYNQDLMEMAEHYRSKNVWKVYSKLSLEDQRDPDLIEMLRDLDLNVNVNWPLAHYKTAVAYLQRNPQDIAATGGTNWQKYLPPRFQKRIFYPELWSAEEVEEWGKSWVRKHVFMP